MDAKVISRKRKRELAQDEASAPVKKKHRSAEERKIATEERKIARDARKVARAMRRWERSERKIAKKQDKQDKKRAKADAVVAGQLSGTLSLSRERTLKACRSLWSTTSVKKSLEQEALLAYIDQIAAHTPVDGRDESWIDDVSIAAARQALIDERAATATRLASKVMNDTDPITLETFNTRDPGLFFFTEKGGDGRFFAYPWATMCAVVRNCLNEWGTTPEALFNLPGLCNAFTRGTFSDKDMRLLRVEAHRQAAIINVEEAERALVHAQERALAKGVKRTLALAKEAHSKLSIDLIKGQLIALKLELSNANVLHSRDRRVTRIAVCDERDAVDLRSVKREEAQKARIALCAHPPTRQKFTADRIIRNERIALAPLIE
jgi:hypothetical protein